MRSGRLGSTTSAKWHADHAQGIQAQSRRSGAERNCSVARTVGILSDAWAFLVIREAFFGARRFETFRAASGCREAP